MLFLGKLLVVLVVIFFLLSILRTMQMEHSPDQARFLAGTLPDPAPDGFYAGMVGHRELIWIGKRFNAAQASGINVMLVDGGLTADRYPFVTSIGKGIRDKQLDVMKIDYSTPDNPLLFHLILDELVQVAPGDYLGKMQIRLIPGYPFTLLFFELTKAPEPSV